MSLSVTTRELHEKRIDHLSISLLRDFVLCRYRLHWHLVDVKPQEKSTLLLGKIIHSIIQLAYYQIPMQEAYQLIWQDYCGPLCQVQKSDVGKILLSLFS